MGYEPLGAEDGKKGLETIRRESPDLVFLDVRMPELDGYQVLEKVQEENLETVVVVITAQDRGVDNAVKPMLLIAYDFVEKPLNTDRFEVVLKKALTQIELKRERTVLQEELQQQSPSFVGEAPLVKQVLATARRAAASDATVLLMGESGTGKEVLARAIHDWSSRHAQPFVAVNCAALPDQLLESTLFGHERGSFTGAVGQKKGKFELARGGTILLDEIAELRPELQVKLLRVLQEGVFERLGGTHTITADVRIIAATNRNLEEARAEGQFREDLFYRLNVVAITLPPLRQRREDIPALADHFLNLYSKDTKRGFKGISGAARKCLEDYSWPGNVRELCNAIERAVVLGLSDQIDVDDLPDQIVSGKGTDSAEEPDNDQPFHQAVESFKRRLILRTLDRTDGNQSKAAQVLDLQRTYLARLITNLDLRDELR